MTWQSPNEYGQNFFFLMYGIMINNSNKMSRIVIVL